MNIKNEKNIWECQPREIITNPNSYNCCVFMLNSSECDYIAPSTIMIIETTIIQTTIPPIITTELKIPSTQFKIPATQIKIPTTQIMKAPTTIIAPIKTTFVTPKIEHNLALLGFIDFTSRRIFLFCFYYYL